MYVTNCKTNLFFNITNIIWLLKKDKWSRMSLNYFSRGFRDCKKCHARKNTTRWINVDLMLGQRRRRWPNIKSTLFQCVVFAGILHIMRRGEGTPRIVAKHKSVSVCSTLTAPRWRDSSAPLCPVAEARLWRWAVIWWSRARGAARDYTARVRIPATSESMLHVPQANWRGSAQICHCWPPDLSGQWGGAIQRPHGSAIQHAAFTKLRNYANDYSNLLVQHTRTFIYAC